MLPDCPRSTRTASVTVRPMSGDVPRASNSATTSISRSDSTPAAPTAASRAAPAPRPQVSAEASGCAP
jgi:hypothetical protein